MTTPTLPANIMAQIDAIVQYWAAASVCHYDTTAVGVAAVKQLFNEVGPGAMVPVVQKVLIEKGVGFAMSLSLDIDKAVAFCKSVAEVAT